MKLKIRMLPANKLKNARRRAEVMTLKAQQRFDKQGKRLLEEAMKKPGIAEVMQVYEASKVSM